MTFFVIFGTVLRTTSSNRDATKQSPPFNPKKSFSKLVDTVNNNEAIISKASPRYRLFSDIIILANRNTAND